ncbi:MAG: DUF1844 domain-containing protein [Candidatus Hydrogenedens sp.]|nr:DUF1844 domain-containing protein [Candidatus Hydrogenedens sp.]
MSDDKPKIIIDEDWKSQAQRERDELARKLEAEKAAAAQGQEEADAVLPDDEAMQHDPFLALIGSLATQTMFALGVIAPPGAKQVMINLDEAAVTLEMLKAIEDKTQGNLTEEEDAALKEALTELERLFSARVAQFQEQAAKQQGMNPDMLRGPGL